MDAVVHAGERGRRRRSRALRARRRGRPRRAVAHARGPGRVGELEPGEVVAGDGEQQVRAAHHGDRLAWVPTTSTIATARSSTRGLERHAPARPGSRRAASSRDRTGVPVGGQLAEQVAEPEGHLDVGQRVAAEADEAVVHGGVRPAEQLGVDGADRLGGGRAGSPAVAVSASRTSRACRSSAACRACRSGAGQLGQRRDPDRVRGQAESCGAARVDASAPAAGAREERAGRRRHDAAHGTPDVSRGQPLSTRSRSMPQAEQLGEPAAAPDDLVQRRRVHAARGRRCAARRRSGPRPRSAGASA